MNIPKVGDVVPVESEIFTGEARIIYIDQALLYVHHMYPIQCEVLESDLHKIDNNHGQSVMRFSLKEILSVPVDPAAEPSVIENTQGDLFSGFDF